MEVEILVMQRLEDTLKICQGKIDREKINVETPLGAKQMC